MKALNFISFPALLSLMYFGCSSEPKRAKDFTRLPQNSVYEEAEIFSDDIDVNDAYEFDDGNPANQSSNAFAAICKESKSPQLKLSDRVVTMVDNQPITGDIRESYQNGTVFLVFTDFGLNRTSKKLLRLQKNANDVSKALECEGTKSKKVYGLFKIGDKYFTGHVREVFKNNVVRFVNDRFTEQFSTIDQSYLEKTKSRQKLKSVLFNYKNQQIKGQIRRVFDKDLLVVKSDNTLFIRKASEVVIED